MGLIGKFLDDACARRPALMRRVLDRPFGTLSKWIDFDEEGEACGCLVGTMALAAGMDAASMPSPAIRAQDCVTRRLGVHWTAVWLVGITVPRVSRRLARGRVGDRHPTVYSDAVTVDLIKRRIARRLGAPPTAPHATRARETVQTVQTVHA